MSNVATPLAFQGTSSGGLKELFFCYYSLGFISILRWCMPWRDGHAALNAKWGIFAWSRLHIVTTTVTNITLKYIAENSLHLNNIPPKDLFQSIYCAPQQQTLLLFSLRHTFLLILELRNTECVPEYLTSFAAIKVLISSFCSLQEWAINNNSKSNIRSHSSHQRLDL